VIGYILDVTVDFIGLVAVIIVKYIKKLELIRYQAHPWVLLVPKTISFLMINFILILPLKFLCDGYNFCTSFICPQVRAIEIMDEIIFFVKPLSFTL
jgi:hypothetical protein